MKKIAINGFGRIGRTALRLIMERDDMEVVAINDLTDPLQLAYLFKYDSIYRTTNASVGYEDDKIIVEGKKIKVYKESDPENLPWKELEIDVVLECTGIFTSKEKCTSHIKAGAKKVIISAPAKDDTIISAASCTTNCLAPVVNLLHKNFGIEKGLMSTVHAMTNDQETLDIPHKKGITSRRGRAASLNIIPTSTGAASLIGKVIPQLNGRLDGVAFRVPVGDGSLIDLTVELNKKVTEEEINNMFKENISDTIKITNAPIVSSDIIGNRAGAVVDVSLTNVMEKDGKVLVKVVAWYDNEMGYTAQMIRTITKL